MRGDGIQQHDSRLREGLNAQYVRPQVTSWGTGLLSAGGGYLDSQMNVGLYNRILRDPFEPAASAGGLNFGWKIMEGEICRPGGPLACNTSGLTLPIMIYAHDPLRCESVTGGYRHRGTQSPSLNGLYFFSEGCAAGRVWVATESMGSWTFEEVAALGGAIASFGEDADGELYLVDISNGELVHVPEPGAAASALGALAALGLTRRRSARACACATECRRPSRDRRAT